MFPEVDATGLQASDEELGETFSEVEAEEAEKRERERLMKEERADEEQEEEEEEEEDEETKDQQESAQPSETVTDAPVKRRRGRPRKNPLPDDYVPRPKPTPKDKRPKKFYLSSVDLDNELTTEFIDDEGETKVDEDGNLLGERQYCLKTVVLPRHPSRLYMIMTDVAKFCNLRDAYIYLQKLPEEPRIYASEDDKDVLVEADLLLTKFKSRAIMILPAKHVFRKFGHHVILNGQPGIDDYYCSRPHPQITNAEEGIEGEDGFPAEFLKNDVVWDFKTMNVAPTHPAASRTANVVKDYSIKFTPMQKRKFMLDAAQSARMFNKKVVMQREPAFYDMHCNKDLVPVDTQPSVVIVEQDLLHAEKTLVIDEHVHVSGASQSRGSRWTSAADPWPNTPQYPVALIPGQHECNRSVFITRFSEEDAKNAAALLAQRDIEKARKLAELRGENLDASLDPTAENANKAAADTQDNAPGQIKLIDLTTYICGAKTLTGGECKRTVVKPGDRCGFHDPLRMVSFSSLESIV